MNNEPKGSPMAEDDEFARVLAEAGEPEPAERDPIGRAMAEVQAGMDEQYASQMARWLRNADARAAAIEAWQRANEAAGIDGGDPERVPWMQPPRPRRIW